MSLNSLLLQTLQIRLEMTGELFAIRDNFSAIESKEIVRWIKKNDGEDIREITGKWSNR